MKKIILTLTLVSCFFSCKENKKQDNGVNKLEIKNINFPRDLINPNKFYAINDSMPKIKRVYSGNYNLIWDIFYSKENASVEQTKAKYVVNYQIDENRIRIYDAYLFEINGNCKECLPEFDCYYFDGRYALLTQENEYERIVLDLKMKVIMQVEYEKINKDNIERITFLTNDFSPFFRIKKINNRLLFFSLKTGGEKSIFFKDDQFQNNNNFDDLNYSQVLLLLKLYSQNKFISGAEKNYSEVY